MECESSEYLDIEFLKPEEPWIVYLELDGVPMPRNIGTLSSSNEPTGVIVETAIEMPKMISNRLTAELLALRHGVGLAAGSGNLQLWVLGLGSAGGVPRLGLVGGGA